MSEQIQPSNLGHITGASLSGSQPEIVPWSMSNFELKTVRGREFISIDHPNKLGIRDETGRNEEFARLTRFRRRYVSQELHDAAIGKSRRIAAALFRRWANPVFLEQCRQKTCFRKEDVNIDPPPRTPLNAVEDGVMHFVQRSAHAVRNAKECYGTDVLADVELGFSRPFSVHEQMDELPFVQDVMDQVGDGTDVMNNEQSGLLSLVISYRHTTAKDGRILNIEPVSWPSVLSAILKLCRRAECTHFRLWTDQILSTRKPRGTLRWVSSGILPYTMYPVFYVMPASQRTSNDLQRMWISIEHLAASLGQGIIHAGDCLTEDLLPKEWLNKYVRAVEGADGVTWMMGFGMEAHAVIRKLCGAIMCGVLRNKALSWASDAQDVIEWASTITSALLYSDIGHSFTCEDCKAPMGYTSGNRIMTLISSATVIVPEMENVEFNDTHPRLDVPALQVNINGRRWDGFREWVPESFLWGDAEDEMRSTRNEVINKTKAIVTSRGGPRAVAVLQFSMAYPPTGRVAVAHLLVGLTTSERNRYTGSVDWSKRFWPIDPLEMWKSFNELCKDVGDRTALYSMACLIGASSSLDYTDIADAVEVSVVDIRKVRW